jgi:hypothetical protein
LTRTTTVALTVRNFSLSASPTSITATHGGASVNDTVTLTMAGGFASAVTFSASNLPTGVTATWSPTSRTTSGTTTLTLRAGSATATGTYTLTLNGTSGSLIQTTPLTLIVN